MNTGYHEEEQAWQILYFDNLSMVYVLLFYYYG